MIFESDALSIVQEVNSEEICFASHGNILLDIKDGLAKYMLTKRVMLLLMFLLNLAFLFKIVNLGLIVAPLNYFCNSH